MKKCFVCEYGYSDGSCGANYAPVIGHIKCEFQIRGDAEDGDLEAAAQEELGRALDATDASSDEREAILEGAWLQADPRDVLRDPVGYAQDQVSWVRDERILD